jgi:Phage integrase family
MDDWGWQLGPWLEHRQTLSVGALFCVINSPRAGAPLASSAVPLVFVSSQGRPVFGDALHLQLRHAHAVEMAREGIPLNVIQRQLGHANLGVTSVYLQGIDTAEIIETVRSRRGPVIPAAAALLGTTYASRPKRTCIPNFRLPRTGAEGRVEKVD